MVRSKSTLLLIVIALAAAILIVRSTLLAPRDQPNRPQVALRSDDHMRVSSGTQMEDSVSPELTRSPIGEVVNATQPSPLPPTVECKGPSGEGIAAAQVFKITSGHHQELLGTTTSDGILRLHEPLGPCSISVKAEGFALIDHQVAQLGWGENLVLRIPRGARMTGHVYGAFASHDSPIEGAVVWAMPKDPVNDFTFIDPDLANRLSKGQESIPHASTDRNGEFVIEGLDPNLKYDFSAIRYGLRTIDALTGSFPISGELNLHMARCWGVLIRYPEDAFPRALEHYGSARDAQMPSVWGVFNRAEPFGVMLDEELLQAWGERRQASPRTCLTILYYSKNGEEDLGALELHASAPGFEPLNLEIPLHFIEDSMEAFTLPLIREPLPTGSVQVRFSDSPLSRAIEPDHDLDCGSVHFHSVDADTMASYSIKWDELDGGLNISDLPIGLYTVHFVAHGGHGYAPHMSEESRESSPNGIPFRIERGVQELELSLDDLGCISVEFLAPDGSEYLGLGNFEVRKLTYQGGQKFFDMGSGTIISKWRRLDEQAVVLASPGTYQIDPIPRVVSISPSIGANSAGRLIDELELEVKAGQTSRVILQTL